MIDFLITFLVQYHFIIFYLIPIILAIKMILFFKHKSRSWKMYNFLYFEEAHIIASRTNQAERAKKVQNILSLTIVLLAFIQIGLFLLIKA